MNYNVVGSSIRKTRHRVWKTRPYFSRQVSHACWIYSIFFLSVFNEMTLQHVIHFIKDNLSSKTRRAIYVVKALTPSLVRKKYCNRVIRRVQLFIYCYITRSLASALCMIFTIRHFEILNRKMGY